MTNDINIDTATDTIEEAEIRILKTASCLSLSKKSQLTFNIGCNTAGEVQFQITGNDGGGYWNDDWVAQSSIQAVLDRQPKGQGITSSTFREIYANKSMNSPGFLAATLLHCGLLQPSTEKARCYELRDPKAFIEEVNALLASAPQSGMASVADLATKSKTLTLKGRPKKT